jgi:hypothetical protein
MGLYQNFNMHWGNFRTKLRTELKNGILLFVLLFVFAFVQPLSSMEWGSGPVLYGTGTMDGGYLSRNGVMEYEGALGSGLSDIALNRPDGVLYAYKTGAGIVSMGFNEPGVMYPLLEEALSERAAGLIFDEEMMQLAWLDSQGIRLHTLTTAFAHSTFDIPTTGLGVGVCAMPGSGKYIIAANNSGITELTAFDVGAQSFDSVRTLNVNARALTCLPGRVILQEEDVASGYINISVYQYADLALERVLVDSAVTGDISRPVAAGDSVSIHYVHMGQWFHFDMNQDTAVSVLPQAYFSYHEYIAVDYSNNAPEFLSSQSVNAALGEVVYVPFTYFDADGDPVFFSGGPMLYNLNSAAARDGFWYYADAALADSAVEFYLSDTRGAQDSGVATIYTRANSRPEWLVYPVEGHVLNSGGANTPMDFSAQDSDGDVLSGLLYLNSGGEESVDTSSYASLDLMQHDYVYQSFQAQGEQLHKIRVHGSFAGRAYHLRVTSGAEDPFASTGTVVADEMVMIGGSGMGWGDIKLNTDIFLQKDSLYAFALESMNSEAGAFHIGGDTYSQGGSGSNGGTPAVDDMLFDLVYHDAVPAWLVLEDAGAGLFQIQLSDAAAPAVAQSLDLLIEIYDGWQIKDTTLKVDVEAAAVLGLLSPDILNVSSGYLHSDTLLLDEMLTGASYPAEEYTWSFYSPDSLDLHIDDANRLLSVSYPVGRNLTGSFPVDVVVSSIGSEEQAEAQWWVNVEYNEPPMINNFPYLEIPAYQDFTEYISLDELVDDLDNPDSLMIWNFSSDVVYPVFDSTNRQVKFMLNNPGLLSGQYGINVSVSDPGGATATLFVTLNVMRNEPVFGTPGMLYGSPSDSVYIPLVVNSLYAGGVVEDTLGFYFDFASSTLYWNSITPGNYSVNLWGEDDLGNYGEITIELLIEETVILPALVSPSAIQLNPGQEQSAEIIIQGTGWSFQGLSAGWTLEEIIQQEDEIHLSVVWDGMTSGNELVIEFSHAAGSQERVKIPLHFNSTEFSYGVVVRGNSVFIEAPGADQYVYELEAVSIPEGVEEPPLSYTEQGIWAAPVPAGTYHIKVNRMQDSAVLYGWEVSFIIDSEKVIYLPEDRWIMAGGGTQDFSVDSLSSGSQLFYWNSSGDWFGETMRYQEINAGYTVAPGQGFWIYTEEEQSIVIPQDTLRSVTLELYGREDGWNQIANPFSFPLDVSTARETGLQFFAWNGEGNEEVEFLKPYEGYWVYTQRDTQLVLSTAMLLQTYDSVDHSEELLSNTATEALSKSIVEKPHVQFSLRMGGFSDKVVVGFDQEKRVLPKVPSQPGEALVLSIEEEKKLHELWQKEASLNTWKLKWNNTVPGVLRAALSVEGVHTLGDKYLYLEVGEQRIAMPKDGEMSLDLGSSDKDIYVIIADSPLLMESKADLKANFFGESLRFEIFVSAAQSEKNWSFRLRNSSGRVIQDQFVGELQPGWNEKTAVIHSLRAGVYFVELLSGSERLSAQAVRF